MEPSRPPFFQALAEPQSPDLFRKLLLLAGARLLVGTALLIATATLTLSSGAETFPRPVEAFLYAIIASIYLGSLVSVWFLRARRHLSTVAHVQIIGDVVAASGLVYLTGGAESVFTILYPLAIVNAAIGLGRRGALLGAVLSGLTFCLLAVGMERAWFSLPVSYLDRAPLQLPRLLLTLAANLSAFVLTAMLAAYLAQALQGARKELAKRETELKGLEALHESILHSALSGILTIDEDGRVLHINDYGKKLTGELEGQRLDQRYPQLAAAAGAGHGETTLVNGAGETRVVGYAASRLANRPGHVIVLQDLTELRRMEEEVRRADRLAAMGKLAAGLAHEIRNPLASMCGSIALLGNAPGLADKERRLLEIVFREGERLEALVSDFLAFARPSQPQLSDVNLPRLVEETLDVFRQDKAAKGFALEVQIEADARVNGDTGQLKQVLWNLLTNASDATDAGGLVRVRLHRADRYVALEVEDSGTGIPQDDLLRIFDPFFTTKDRGTGLGLAIVHGIVEAHGGEIAVRSSPGKGSTFAVRLPVLGLGSSARA